MNDVSFLRDELQHVHLPRLLKVYHQGLGREIDDGAGKRAMTVAGVPGLGWVCTAIQVLLLARALQMRARFFQFRQNGRSDAELRYTSDNVRAPREHHFQMEEQSSTLHSHRNAAAVALLAKTWGPSVILGTGEGIVSVHGR